MDRWKIILEIFNFLRKKNYIPQNLENKLYIIPQL